MVDLRPYGADEVGLENKMVSLANLGRKDGSFL